MSTHSTRTILLATLVIAVAQMIIPPLTGMWSFALAWLWLAAVVLVFGAHAAVIGAGIVGALFVELVTGMAMGSTVAGFIAAAGFYRVAARFITIRPLADRQSMERSSLIANILVGCVLAIIIPSVAAIFEALVYGREILWSAALRSWYIPQTFLSIGLQLFVACVILERIVAAQRQSIL